MPKCCCFVVVDILLVYSPTVGVDVDDILLVYSPIVVVVVDILLVYSPIVVVVADILMVYPQFVVVLLLLLIYCWFIHQLVTTNHILNTPQMREDKKNIHKDNNITVPFTSFTYY